MKSHHFSSPKRVLAATVLAVVLVGASGTTRAQDESRDVLIAQVLSTWGPAIESQGGTTEQLEMALVSSSDQTLLAAAEAESLADLDTILLGPAAGGGTQPEGGVIPATLGSTTEDYVLTAVTPCRVVDTRNAPGVPNAAGSTNSYVVYGAVVGQGGAAAGCPSPRGEPRAVHVNVTIVPMTTAGTSGFATVWPFSSPLPTASLVNYKQGALNAIANAATVQSFFSVVATADISVFTNRAAHVIIDVLGYYHEVDPKDLARSNHSGYDIETALIATTTYEFVDDFSPPGIGPGAHDDDPSNGPLSSGDIVTIQDRSDVNVQSTMNVWSEQHPQPPDPQQGFPGFPSLIEGEITPCYRVPPHIPVAGGGGEDPVPPVTCANGDFGGSGWPGEGFEAVTGFCFLSVAATGLPPAIPPEQLAKFYQHSVQTSCTFRDLPAGTYEFGVCAKTGSDYFCAASLELPAPVPYFVGGVKVDIHKLPE